MGRKGKKEKNYIEFTSEMKRDYTILVPTMLPDHFKLVIEIFRSYGYKMDLLESSGKIISETGLRYVHNDTCYPAILVIGQFIHAVLEGGYDPHKVALLITQTGGGCRASNYISLLRKALKKAGYEYIPVISFNVIGMEKHSGFQLQPKMMVKMLYAVLYGDLLMSLKNQCKPYEKVKGTSEALRAQWTQDLVNGMSGKKANLSYKAVKENYRKIIRSFQDIEKTEEKKIKVGVVGEIFVKYSPLGNNNLEQFLDDEGAEVVIPGLLDFLLFYCYELVLDYKLYHIGGAKVLVGVIGQKLLSSKQNDLILLMKEESHFRPPMPFSHVTVLTEGYIHNGAKMGEGWLLTAEMLELIEEGVCNIVCTQPFGCLPNHIVGKGMMKPIREKNPDVNIVAIDYDAGATAINQENRLKLMLANARDNLAKETERGEEKIEISE